MDWRFGYTPNPALRCHRPSRCFTVDIVHADLVDIAQTLHLPNYDNFSFWETQKYENGQLCALRMSPISRWMLTFCLSADQN